MWSKNISNIQNNNCIIIHIKSNKFPLPLFLYKLLQNFSIRIQKKVSLPFHTLTCPLFSRTKHAESFDSHGATKACVIRDLPNTYGMVDRPLSNFRGVPLAKGIIILGEGRKSRGAVWSVFHDAKEERETEKGSRRVAVACESDTPVTDRMHE